MTSLVDCRVRDLERALRAENARRPLPPAADREAWGEVRRRLGPPGVRAVLATGEAAAREGVPALPATLWLAYQRTGDRLGYERPYCRRRELLSDLAVAECVEGEGRFLDPVLDLAWAICEESSWALPAANPDLTAVPSPHFDLGVTETALLLAELHGVLGDRLPAAAGHRIRAEVDRRCLRQLLSRHDMDWLFPLDVNGSNWTAVCCGAVAGAALHTEPDPGRLAEILLRVARPLADYVLTFDDEGGTSEGVLYWDYGFSHFVMLGHLVEHATGGRVTVFDDPRVRQVAQFPLRTRLSRGRYVSFADHSDMVFWPSMLGFLSRRLALPQLAALAAEQPEERERTDRGRLWWRLRDLLWPVPEHGTRLRPAACDRLHTLQWMISRVDPESEDSLVLAVKGGHNGEMHNHNDVGNLIVHAGGESLVADLGRGAYSRTYFNPRTRYTHFLTSSRGHSVPVPNGCLQGTGADYRAVDIHQESTATADTMTMQLREAYPPQARVRSLRRTVTLDRTAGTVELRDEVSFQDGPGSYECPLVTLAEVVTDEPGVVELRGKEHGVRVRYDPARVRVSLDTEPGVQLPEDVVVEPTRVVFAAYPPAAESVVRLVLQRSDPT